MDTLTHALSGALLARATATADPRPGALDLRERSLAGLLAAAFPDIDFVILFFDPLVYLNVHRGVTHSVLLLPVWTVALASLLAFLFSRFRRKSYDWRAFLGVCALGLGVHIAGDAITAYGTQILAPVSDWRVALSTTFVIDPWFTAIIVFGLLACAWRPRLAARLGLLVLGGYVGLQALLHQQALTFGEHYAQAKGMTNAKLRALPQPFSPFNWRIVVTDGDGYHTAQVNLRASEPPRPPPADAGFLQRVAAAYRPPGDLRWRQHDPFGSNESTRSVALDAWNQAGFEDYRRFAVLPMLYRVDQDGPETCVWFIDLRFVLNAMTPSFRYGMCRQAGGKPWRLYRLRPFSENTRERLRRG